MTEPVTPTPISALPDAPLITDSPAVFNDKAFPFAQALEPLRVQINASAADSNTNAIAAKEGANSASAFSDAAAASVTAAAAQVSLAEDAKDSALVAAAAAQAAAGLPTLVGNAGKSLTVLPDESGVIWDEIITIGSQDYTVSQSINKSIFGSATYVFIELWGGGASGGAAVGSAGVLQPPGGEGGSYISKIMRISDLSTTTTLTIGAGGIAVSATSSGTAVLTRGNNGGNSTFSGLTAYGGLSSIAASPEVGASNSASGSNGGQGGGLGALSFSADPNIRLVSGPGGSSSLGGGGGGGGTSVSSFQFPGSASNAGNGGFGFNTASPNQIAPSGVIPSGGGGGIRTTLSGTNTATSGAGARGQARLTWW